MAKVFSTLGYAALPEVEERIGIETSCRLADGTLPEPAGTARRHRARRRGRGMRRRDRRLRCRRRRRRSRARRGRPRRDRARGGRPLQPRQLSAGPPRLDRDPLPRRRPDHRRGQPADPGPGRESRRRHDGDQLRDLLPRARGGPRQLARRARGELGPRPRPLLRRGRGVPAGDAARPRAAWAATASWRWRAPRRSASPAGRSPATPATACSAAPVPTAAGSTPSAACTSATCRARLRPEPGSAPGSRRAGCWSRTAARSGSSAWPAARQRLAGAAYTVRARRATIVAGGAFGTPELLLRSGLGGEPGRAQPPHPSGLLGRRPLRGGGARLGGRHAELLHRRVGARARPARGDLHAARLRRRLAAGRRPRPPGSDARVRPHLLDRGSARRPLGRPGRPAAATAR